MTNTSLCEHDSAIVESAVESSDLKAGSSNSHVPACLVSVQKGVKTVCHAFYVPGTSLGAEIASAAVVVMLIICAIFAITWKA